MLLYWCLLLFLLKSNVPLGAQMLGTPDVDPLYIYPLYIFLEYKNARPRESSCLE